jgi:formylmethanofuran dehydrogenase subunit B
VIFWRADPCTTHPRHAERYSIEPQGLFVASGRSDRYVVDIDTHPTETSRQADQFLQVTEGADLQLVEALRALVGNPESAPLAINGISPQQLTGLAERLKNCRYGALFFGAGQGTLDQPAVEGMLQLVTELCRFTRFTAHAIPKSGGLRGAENVLTWQTGFPFAVSFVDGYPRHDTEQFTANNLLERGAVDACVLVGSEGAAQLSPTAQSALQQLPVIALDYPNFEPAFTSAVQFTTAVYGVHAPGTAYRMDGVPIPLRKLVDSPYPTDDEVLNQIAAAANIDR